MHKENQILELKRLVLNFETNYSVYKDKKTIFNEQMTRQQYIDQFLNLLGWDITNSKNLSFNEREVVAEEYSKFNRSDRPDYTIRMNGSSIFYVEAKKVNVSIENDIKSAMQVRRYGWNSGHKVAVLTNFEYLAIYTTYKQPVEGDSVSNNRYKLFYYKDFVDNFEEIYFLLSRESVVNGTFDRWTNNIAPKNVTKISLDKVFLEQLNEWRVLIAKDLLATDKEKFKDLRKLNEEIQSFLNQLIFLRFIEDNNFEDAEKLRTSINKHVNYKEYFKELDKKYNSGIFNNPDVILSISDEVLTNIVENLYFPNASYDFSVIDLSILSRIYENFLQEELKFDVFGGIKLEKTKNARVKAVISTPDNVVKLMVQNELRESLKGLSPEEIADIRIGDLAVGSGIFLIEAYNFIENNLVDWYASEQGVFPTLNLVPFDIKKKIMKNVFRGFDINYQAVQLTKFSLLLRLLTNENKERIDEVIPLLPSLEDTIIHGNSLVDEIDLDIKELTFDESKEIVPTPTKIFQNLKFDIILGNPPYIQTKDIMKVTSKKEVDIYKNKYNSVFKQYDKYFLFIERTLMLLKQTGSATLLVPNKFFTVGAAKKLRELIMKNNALSSIIDFETIQIFNGVINYVTIVRFSDFENSKFQYSTVNSIKGAFKLSDDLTYDMNNLDENLWFLTSDEKLREQYNYAKKNFPSMEEIVIPKNGIQTSADKIYLLDKSNIVREKDGIVDFEVKRKTGIESFRIERELLKEFHKIPHKMRGESYMIKQVWKYVIFPYENGNIIPLETMKEYYPNALNYLENHKAELLPRELGGSRDVQYYTEWYQYGRTQYLKEANVDKLLVGVMSNRPIVNIDRNRMLFSSGGTAGNVSLILKEDTLYELEYIQAWLSHPFTDKIFQRVGSSFEGDYYTHGTGTYKDIPLLPIDFSDSFEKEKYDCIVKSVKEIESINEKILALTDEAEINFNLKKKHVYIEEINTYIDQLLAVKVEQNNE